MNHSDDDGFIESVLLQLDIYYQNVQYDNDIVITVDHSLKIKDVLSRVEKIVSHNDGVITDYSFLKDKNSVKLVLEIRKDSKTGKSYHITVSTPSSSVVPSEFSSSQENLTRAKVCIILDDAGYSNPLTVKFIQLPVKMGIAVLPFLKNSVKTARLIKESGKEVILHMPMEPKDYERRKIRLFKKEILISMSTGKIHRVMDEMLNNVPFVTGINNHQGSGATADIRVMEAVLLKVKEKNLFFVDSLTSRNSVSKKVAKKLKVDYSRRDVFLDNKDDYQYVKKQMEQLIKIALKRGQAVGIGHISKKSTYRVIRDYIPLFKDKKIEMVNPSDIIDKFSDKEVTSYVTENYCCFN